MSTINDPYASFDALRAELGLPDEFEVCRLQWEESSQAYAEASNDFLSPEFVEETCRWLEMGEEVAEAYRQALPALHENAALMRLAWHGHWILCAMPEDRDYTLGAWPGIPEHLGEAGRMFYGYVLLTGAPHLRKLHAARGITERVTIDTLNDIEVWTHTYRKQHNCWGCDHKGWLMNHFRLDLFKLGRLEFAKERMRADFQAFRHRKTGEFVVLTGEGMRFRRDGQFDGADGVSDEEGAWTAFFREDDEAYEGCYVSPRGFACPEVRRLPRTEWEYLLKGGDPVLGTHIPASGPLRHEDCLDAYRQAAWFFPEYVPDHRAQVFTCWSWLLDPQLRDYLPDTSNIVRFLSDWYLLPGQNANDKQTIRLVLGRDVTDPLKAPVQTSLQRIIVEHIKAGKRWRGHGGLIFLDAVKDSRTAG